MNDKDNTYISKGNKYLIEIEVDEYVKESEGALLRSIFDGSHILPGIRVNVFYKYQYDKDALLQDVKRQVLQDIQNGINQITLEKL